MISTTCPDATTTVRFDRRQLRRAARRHGPPWSLLGLLWRQVQAERRIRRNGGDFRHSSNAEACAAYCALAPEDFVLINARQAWSNWRTIPANLDGLLPDHALQVLDLCCGTGDSTAVLAWCCPPGSQILGLEISPHLVERATRRRFLDRSENPATVRFRAQSVLDPFCDVDGQALPAASVDLINASGAVGCHFGSEASEQLVSHCTRVLRPGGLATIDAGPDGTTPDRLQAIFEQQGFRLIRRRRSCLVDRYRQLCLRYCPD